MNLQKFTDSMNIYFLRKTMKYSFPQPEKIPYEVKKNVMNTIYLWQKPLLKRSFLIKKISWYVMIIWVFVIFTLFYFRSFDRDTILDQNTFDIQKAAISYKSTTSPQEREEDLTILEENINDIDVLVTQTEDLLSELDSLI